MIKGQDIILDFDLRREEINESLVRKDRIGVAKSKRDGSVGGQANFEYKIRKTREVVTLGATRPQA